MQNNSNKLALLSLIINAFLALAVIILFVRNPKASGEAEHDSSNPVDTMDVSKLHEKGEGAVIVYYNADTMNTKCSLLLDLQNDLMEAEKDAQSKIERKQNSLKSWDEKWQKRFPLTSTEQDQYMKEGEKLQLELMQLQQSLQEELYSLQSSSSLLAVTRISNYCRDLALDNGYDYILSYQTGGQVLFANPKMDITDALLESINTDYVQSSTDSAEVEPAE